jgi:fructoselysine-6-P-deglycase FrlB-like protein
VLYLGRGSAFPLALEGALKLKEISYIHAEGYAAGEMKHGPIALIDEAVPVIVLAPNDDLFEKTLGNVEEVMARGGRVVMISDAAGVARLGDRLASGIAVPAATRLSHRCSMRSRSSSSPTTSRSSRAPMSTSRATPPRVSPSSRRSPFVLPACP